MREPILSAEQREELTRYAGGWEPLRDAVLKRINWLEAENQRLRKENTRLRGSDGDLRKQLAFTKEILDVAITDLVGAERDNASLRDEVNTFQDELARLRQENAEQALLIGYHNSTPNWAD